MVNKFCQIIIIILFLLSSCNNKNTKKEGSEKTSNTTNDNEFLMFKEECYADSIKWLVFDSTLIDTVVYFRNYQKNDSSRRITCNLDYIDPKCESLIWKNKNILGRNKHIKRMDKFEFIYYEKSIENDVIIHLYITDNESLKTFEDSRYLIRENKIIGINIFPGFSDEFVPYDKFKKMRDVEM